MKVFINSHESKNIIQISKETTFGVKIYHDSVFLYARTNGKEYILFHLSFELGEIAYPKSVKEELEEVYNILKYQMIPEITSTIEAVYKKDDGRWYDIDIYNIYSYNNNWCINVDWTIDVKQIEFIEIEKEDLDE